MLSDNVVGDFITINGPAATLHSDTPNKTAWVSFNGVQSQQVTVKIRNNTIRTYSYVLLDPTGNSHSSGSSSGDGNVSGDLPGSTLFKTGTYTFIVQSSVRDTGSMEFSVTSP